MQQQYNWKALTLYSAVGKFSVLRKLIIRKISSVLCHLRSGYCHLESSSDPFSLHDSKRCLCGAEEIVDHLLFHCPMSGAVPGAHLLRCLAAELSQPMEVSSGTKFCGSFCRTLKDLLQYNVDCTRWTSKPAVCRGSGRPPRLLVSSFQQKSQRIKKWRLY